MSLIAIDVSLLEQIRANGEVSYPEEGAGFLLGTNDGRKRVQRIIPLHNARAGSDRRNRYLMTPQDYTFAEVTAESAGLDVLGVFHSHPDHAAEPSNYDREWAQPNFSYVITEVRSGRAVQSRAWVLAEDRSGFQEESIES